MDRTKIIAGLAISGLCISGAALAQTSGSGTAAGEVVDEAKVEVRSKQPFGQYLTDASGRALYMFEKDKPGQSTCYDACAKAWPPFLTSEKPRKGEDVVTGKVDTIERKDGQMQVSYDSMPLYYYIKDKGAGSTTGQDVTDRFGEWYLVSPSGEKIEAKKG